MDKLKIGVYLNDNLIPHIGGRFSYAERLVDEIDDFDFDKKIEIVFITQRDVANFKSKKTALQIPVSKYHSELRTPKIKFLSLVFSLPFLRFTNISNRITQLLAKKTDAKILGFFYTNKLDLIFYPYFEISPFSYPFINTSYDVGNKSLFNLDYFKKHNVENYEHLCHITYNTAFALFVDSQQSKMEIEQYYRINPDRIFIVPLFPGKVIDTTIDCVTEESILAKWEIQKDNYFFYPAQFWGFKNHYGLIMGFKKVLESKPNLKLVLSGSDQGNMTYIKNIVKNEKLDTNVIFTGFVSNEELCTFYSNAIALVFPSLMGPTNMPLLEAHYLGCKVVCSNLAGHREQMKNNALYFNPYDHLDIATQMLASFSMDKPTPQKTKPHNPVHELNTHFLKLYNIRKTFGIELRT